MGSHLFAAINGWAYPMSRAEMMAIASFTQAVNANREKGSEPFVPDWPWPTEAPVEQVTPEDRARAKAQLKQYSAFGQIRTK
ncbi:hypothetical protein [Paenarthrobacter nicotinovorans]|uniref:hypothetical protein n=1 Tax=Paenarthrobacter nicotinovorans TaxID=29320 RepID=UPI002485C8B8|nr:hypothetical protein [Paenarthrobacter nicotinovorans]MDI2019697.1 hypothetical protein [Paenarthrobacter nicotinovorans]